MRTKYTIFITLITLFSANYAFAATAPWNGTTPPNRVFSYFGKSHYGPIPTDPSKMAQYWDNLNITGQGQVALDPNVNPQSASSYSCQSNGDGKCVITSIDAQNVYFNLTNLCQTPGPQGWGQPCKTPDATVSVTATLASGKTETTAGLTILPQFPQIEFMTRQSYGYGLYVSRVAYNAGAMKNTPTVSSMPFLYTLAPLNASPYSRLNRWNEIDWEYVPDTDTPSSGKRIGAIANDPKDASWDNLVFTSGYPCAPSANDDACLPNANSPQGGYHELNDAFIAQQTNANFTWQNFLSQFTTWPAFNGIGNGFLTASQMQGGGFITTTPWVVVQGDHTATAQVNGDSYPMKILGPNDDTCDSNSDCWGVGAPGAAVNPGTTQMYNESQYIYNAAYDANAGATHTLNDYNWYAISITPDNSNTICMYISPNEITPSNLSSLNPVRCITGADVTDANALKGLGVNRTTGSTMARDIALSDSTVNNVNFPLFGNMTQSGPGSWEMLFQIWTFAAYLPASWSGQPYDAMTSDSYLTNMKFYNYDQDPNKWNSNLITNVDFTQATQNNWMNIFTQNFSLQVSNTDAGPFNFGLSLATYEGQTALDVNLHDVVADQSYAQAFTQTGFTYQVAYGNYVNPIQMTVIPGDGSNSYTLAEYPDDNTGLALWPYNTTIKITPPGSTDPTDAAIIVTTNDPSKETQPGSHFYITQQAKSFSIVASAVPGQITINQPAPPPTTPVPPDASTITTSYTGSANSANITASFTVPQEPANTQFFIQVVGVPGQSATQPGGNLSWNSVNLAITKPPYQLSICATAPGVKVAPCSGLVPLNPAS